MAQITARQIEAMNCPEPTDPEIRIAEFRFMLSTGLLEDYLVEKMEHCIAVLQAQIDNLAGNPTRYVPGERLGVPESKHKFRPRIRA